MELTNKKHSKIFGFLIHNYNIFAFIVVFLFIQIGTWLLFIIYKTASTLTNKFCSYLYTKCGIMIYIVYVYIWMIDQME